MGGLRMIGVGKLPKTETVPAGGLSRHHDRPDDGVEVLKIAREIADAGIVCKTGQGPE